MMTDDTMSSTVKRVREDITFSELIARFFRATEIDTRMLGMIGALLLIWVGFDILSGGLFLTPRNLWNLSVQTASIGVMATGMVLIIITRSIDLSVGSILGFTGMIMATMQAEWLPVILGFDNPLTWIIALLVGMFVGATIGGIQGGIIAYMGVPSFIVTLGGLLVWRGLAWWVTSGRTVAPMDSTFSLMGGGVQGSIGSVASWAVAVIACVGILFMIVNSRTQRKRFQFPLRPLWAELMITIVSCSLVIGVVWVFNNYPWPRAIAQRYAAENNIPIPEGGLFIAHGIAIPVLIAVITGVIMTFIATRTRFGRYVFAIGGNPEAAELAGIKTKILKIKVFALMGMLCAISAAISSARLNAATNALGTLDELYVIAAAVIGGASLAGGSGTIVGAMIGAVVMQSLQSGMVLLGIDTPFQNIVVGMVLIIAVWLDTIYKDRAK